MTETFVASGGSVFKHREATGMVYIQPSLDDRDSEIGIPASDLCQFVTRLQIKKEIELLQLKLEQFVVNSRKLEQFVVNSRKIDEKL